MTHRHHVSLVAAIFADLSVCCCACSVMLAGVSSAAEKSVPTKADVSYSPHEHQLLDVYLPEQGTEPHPVLLWFGGLWKPAKHAPDVNRFFAANCAVGRADARDG